MKSFKLINFYTVQIHTLEIFYGAPTPTICREAQKETIHKFFLIMVAKHKNSEASNSDMPSCKVLLLSKKVKSLDVIRREKNDMLWFLRYTIQKNRKKHMDKSNNYGFHVRLPDKKARDRYSLFYSYLDC